jgi:hypothetical protein
MNRTIIPSLFAASLVLGASSLAAAAAKAELSRGNELTVDTPARLVVTVDGTVDRRPPLHVPGADIAYSGQMSSSTITNGRATTQTSFLYTLVPRKAGPLTIPPIHVGTETTDPVQATVSATPATSSAGPSHGTGVAASPDRVTPAAAGPGRAFVRLDVPSRTMYVGEAIPVKIRAYFRAGTAATLKGAPTLSSAAFTLSQLSDKPTQTEVQIDDVPYLLATWTAVLSPAKPTDDKISIELPVEIAYREPRAARGPSLRDLMANDPFASDLDTLFDDPFFADPFSGMDTMFDVGAMRTQTLTLRNDVGRARIVDLPDAKKPADFSGAVGQFTLTADPVAGELRAGEPSTITFRVSGTGNFDRVALAPIPASADWKVYPGSSTLEPSKRSPVSATKVFTQTLVPTRAGTLEIPAVSFSYFDPTAKAYRTVSTPRQSAVVAPPANGGAADPGLASSVPHANMTANRLERGETHTSLVPYIHRDGFWLLPSSLIVVSLLFGGVGFARRSEAVSDRRRHRRLNRAVAHEQREFRDAATRGDSAAFFTSARRAMQLRLAAAWNIAPETITAADVMSRLGEDGRAIRDVFEHADGITYAPGIEAPGALDGWRTTVEQQLAFLETHQ